MGARLLTRWINDPLISKKEIEKRQYHFGNINGKDMISLKNSIRYLPELKKELSIIKSDYLKEIYLKLETLEDIYSIIDEMIVEEPPITITEGRSY